MSYRAKILIVDDEPRLCNSLKVFLNNQNSDIYTAYSGTEAIDLLAKHKFDLVLLDMVMPDMTGYQVIDYINVNGLKPLIIIMTGYTSTEPGVESVLKGIFDYLRKPFDLEKLLKTVEDALHMKAREERGKQAGETGTNLQGI
ncbi:MAG: response regulator [Deltaproteobacteria bacterium]|nr:MAG: response regulator [Deltaproteobacteria bacterium]